MDLNGKVAVVTGAGKGLGKGIAKKLYKNGASVALWDIDYDLVKDTAKEIDPSEEKTLPVKADVTNQEMIKEAVDKTVEKFNKIEILVNNAGISNHKPLEEMTLENFQKVIEVNLTGTFLCCKAVVRIMKEQEYGKIVNIASLGGRTGRPGVGVNYAASKAGVIGLTQNLARELGEDNIYVNSICPGPILTEQTKQYSKEVFASWNKGRAIPKDGLPEDVADSVLFLASDKSNWVTGVTLDVNGGILIK